MLAGLETEELSEQEEEVRLGEATCFVLPLSFSERENNLKKENSMDKRTEGGKKKGQKEKFYY